ncbi:hypothetical protein N9139_00785 [Akkermansiaceae bacterium]|nr:hypothetical protein [Akkermansiaceae bacterium]MDB4435990.1 hypothetical protein [Akkermansiaceae bacterium]
MLEVFHLLENKEHSADKRVVDKSLKKLLQDLESTAERRNIITVEGDSKLGKFSRKLCGYAGEACFREEYETLTRLSPEPIVARNLELGFNLALVRSDPVSAVESTLAFVKVPRTGAKTILNQLFDQLAQETDFAQIDTRFVRARGLASLIKDSNIRQKPLNLITSDESGVR